MLHTTPSGLLIIDKPQGVTSFDAVAAVRGALHIKKVGHAGTLDPMATGTLVIAFGHATRLLNAIVAHDKTYEATIRLGLRTTTDDAEGEVLVGGHDVREYDLEALRDAVSVVLQKNVLFSGTILENLRWGDKNATEEECRRACELACADEFIRSFPARSSGCASPARC